MCVFVCGAHYLTVSRCVHTHCNCAQQCAKQQNGKQNPSDSGVAGSIVSAHGIASWLLGLCVSPCVCMFVLRLLPRDQKRDANHGEDEKAAH